uniref:Capsid protein n=1 Tax=Anelloviridae sp. TaxID=2055263 RepID=A0A2H4R0L0_9VIRU|nr:ORF1 [Anelloviridae sp.]
MAKRFTSRRRKGRGWRSRWRRGWRPRFVSRSHRRRKWRRRRRRVQVRPLTEVQPRFRRKCIIRGLYSPLVMGWSGAHVGAEKEPQHFNPVRRYMPSSNGQKVQFGGWALGSFTLAGLYREHQWYRNRWSFSNCGFDLASYHGTTLYLEQHHLYDYLVFIDPEYRSIAEFAKQATFHPIELITHPQSILVKSRARAGPRRARKVFIPRPSWWDSGWEFAKDIANKGIFCWFVMFVDLDYPWILARLDTGDINAQPSTSNEFINWWRLGDQGWKKEFDDYVRETTTQGHDSKIGETNERTDEQWAKMMAGPMVLKFRNINEHTFAEQVLWFYKSVWRWGWKKPNTEKSL